MYQYIEFGGIDSSGSFTRNIWGSRQDTPKYREHFNNTDFYRTVWSYKDKNPESGCTAPLYFDIDNDDLNISKRDALLLCDIFIKNFFIPPDFLNIRFSGNKGFHIIISESIFDLPDIINKNILWKHIATKLNEFIPSIDLQIYDTRRLFRVNNSINGKSGLYKIPLSYEELCVYDMDKIRSLAQTTKQTICKQPVFIPNAHKYLLQLWAESNKGNNLVKPPCILKIEEGGIEGSRHDNAFTLAVFYKNAKIDRYKIFKKLVSWNKKNKPELKEEEIKSVVNSIYNREYQIGCSTYALMNNCIGDTCKFKKIL